jgi:DNA-binding NarL/FixJ family response regulator
MIHVAIVDNDPLVRDALSRQLGERPTEFALVGAVATVDELMARDDLNLVDVVLLDVLGTGSPLSRSVDLIMEAGARIIAITTDPSLPEVRRVVRQTTISAVDKNDLAMQMHQAIRLCAGGVRVISPAFQDGSARVSDPALTERQQQVIALVASGIQAKVAARRLGIAYRTLCDHVTEIVAKLNDAGHRTDGLLELHYKAIELGYIPDPRNTPQRPSVE